MKFFNLDSPLMKVLGRMADLMWLNLLTFLFFLPAAAGLFFIFTAQMAYAILPWIIVAILGIPCGAAFTALHYVCLKMVRDEEGYISKDFFKSFKLNFKQATIIWLIASAVVIFVGFDYKCLQYVEGGNRIIFGALTAAAIMLACTLVYVFPVLSHFDNPIKGTIRNSFFMSILTLPKTVLMLLLCAVPAALFILVMYYETAYWLVPVIFMFFFSFPAYMRAKLYNKTFKRFEPEATETVTDDMDWTVNMDEVTEESEELIEGTSAEEAEKAEQ